MLNRRHLIGMVKDWGLALVIVLGALTVWNLVAGPGVTVPTGAEAPDFTLADLDGQEVTLSEARGEVVVLNFWATWCGPCRVEIPEFSAFHGAHPDVPVYGISVDENMSEAQLASASRRLGIDYPVLHDARSAVANAYGVSGLPTTVIVGPDGAIRDVHVGPMDQVALERVVFGR